MKIDRSGWPAGPWDNEPDQLKWIDTATGYLCSMKRTTLGAWCGYVGVPPEHPCYGLKHDCLSAKVHGGLTYSRCSDPDSTWWLGFDCLHFDDLCPQGPFQCGVYRDIAYVREQCTALAAQLVPPWLRCRDNIPIGENDVS